MPLGHVDRYLITYSTTTLCSATMLGIQSSKILISHEIAEMINEFKRTKVWLRLNNTISLLQWLCIWNGIQCTAKLGTQYNIFDPREPALFLSYDFWMICFNQTCQHMNTILPKQIKVSFKSEIRHCQKSQVMCYTEIFWHYDMDV